jgi:hypothetical protein
MPFNYQSLKNLTSAAIVDGSLAESDVANLGVTAGKLELGAVTNAKIGTGAVDLAASTVTNTLPVSKGGTNLTSLGGAYRAVYSNGSTVSHQPHGVASIQVWTGNGTWTRPTGVRYIKVQVQGGAGGGGGHGEGGAAGGYAERFLDVTGIESVGITIGGGGGGTYYSGAAGNGGGSSFGPYISAGGGHGANRQNQHSGGVSGAGSGGNLNIHTGGGFSHHARDAQAVAESFFGGGAPSSYPNGGQFGHNHEGHSALGSGGAGAHFHSYRGSNGRPGIIIVTNYY